MEATRSSETSVYIKPTRRHIPEDGTLLTWIFKKKICQFSVISFLAPFKQLLPLAESQPNTPPPEDCVARRVHAGYRFVYQRLMKTQSQCHLSLSLYLLWSAWLFVGNRNFKKTRSRDICYYVVCIGQYALHSLPKTSAFFPVVTVLLSGLDSGI
jgi:hypothetical protein